MVITPTNLLAPYISHYMVTKLVQGQATYLSATSTPTLVIFRRGEIWFHHENLPIKRSPSAYIEGPFLHPRHSYANTDTEIISIHFRPSMLEHVISVPVSEFSHYCIPLADLSCPQLAMLTADVVDALCIDEVIKQIELRLMRLLAVQNMQQRRKAKPLRIKPELIHQPTKTIATLSSLSVRQLERRFLASYGVTLRDWRRLDRAAKALILLIMSSNNSSIATIAHNANYFDHAHMCRDFRELCGVSPQEFSRRLTYDLAYWPFRKFEKTISPERRIRTSENSSYIG